MSELYRRSKRLESKATEDVILEKKSTNLADAPAPDGVFEKYSSAVDHALRLPEIVATILLQEKTCARFLYTCLLINRTFLFEASPILWQHCGGSASYSDASKQLACVTPMIKHLALIKNSDSRRAQFYASFVKTLIFGIEPGVNGFGDSYALTRWHSDLAALSFPRLTNLEFDFNSFVASMKPEDAVLHYAQSTVTSLTITSTLNLSDSFLDKLNASCPLLCTFNLNCPAWKEKRNISKLGTIRFLDNAKSLGTLDIRYGHETTWSAEVFDSLSRHQNLRRLICPDIQDTELQFIGQKGPVFPSLTSLFTGMSDRDLSTLARHLPNLQELELDNLSLPPSHHILAAASLFPRLTQLEICFNYESSITADDLLLLATKCPNLTGLYFLQEPPKAIGITDATISALALALPNLERLSLHIAYRNPLTWQGILALPRSLKVLCISCNVDWAEAIATLKPHHFPNLENLLIALDRDNRHGSGLTPVSQEFSAQTMTNARQFAEWAPKMAFFKLCHGDEWDEYWENAVADICKYRALSYGQRTGSTLAFYTG